MAILPSPAMTFWSRSCVFSPLALTERALEGVSVEGLAQVVRGPWRCQPRVVSTSTLGTIQVQPKRRWIHKATWSPARESAGRTR